MSSGLNIFFLILILFFVTAVILFTNKNQRSNYSLYKYWDFRIAMSADICSIIAPILYFIYIWYSFNTFRNNDENIDDFNKRKALRNEIANKYYWSSIGLIVLSYLLLILAQIIDFRNNSINISY